MPLYSALFENENRKGDEIVQFDALSAQIGSRCFTQYNSSLSELDSGHIEPRAGIRRN